VLLLLCVCRHAAAPHCAAGLCPPPGCCPGALPQPVPGDCQGTGRHRGGCCSLWPAAAVTGYHWPVGCRSLWGLRPVVVYLLVMICFVLFFCMVLDRNSASQRASLGWVLLKVTAAGGCASHEMCFCHDLFCFVVAWFRMELSSSWGVTGVGVALCGGWCTCLSCMHDLNTFLGKCLWLPPEHTVCCWPDQENLCGKLAIGPVRVIYVCYASKATTELCILVNHLLVLRRSSQACPCQLSSTTQSSCTTQTCAATPPAQLLLLTSRLPAAVAAVLLPHLQLCGVS
jgi:hypothetical protein